MVGVRMKESRFHDIYFPLRKDLRVIFYAPHAAAPKREYYTGTIVKEINRRIGAAGLVAQVSRVIADLNRNEEFRNTQCNCSQNYQKEAVRDLYKQLEEILKDLNVIGKDKKVQKDVLLIGIHGMKDDWGYGIILGTMGGSLCEISLRDRMKEKLELILKSVDSLKQNKKLITCEDIFPGDPSLSEIRNYFGEKLNIIQMEISKTLRQNFTEELITALSMVSLTLF